MKKTKLPKKLFLNKKTVTNLDFLQQKLIKGGCTCIHETCVTACGTCETCGTCVPQTNTCGTYCAIMCFELPTITCSIGNNECN